MRSSATRRTVLKNATLAFAAGITAPYVRGAYAAGKLTLGCWDHWVPGANSALTKICNEWGEKNKVEVHIDYITSQGEKDKLTAAAEAQAGTGHDIMSHRDWNVQIHQRMLEPLDDVVGQLIKQHGPISPVAEYLAKIKGTWRGVPTAVGSQVKPCQSRFDLYQEHCGIDLRAMFPADESKYDKAKIDTWTWDVYLDSAQKLHKAGFPVGLPMGQTSDAVDWVGALFMSFGAVLIDEKDNIKVNSDETRTVLEYLKKLMAVNPPEVYAWDDAGNNRWIISGKGSGIMNPPSSWAVAKREPDGGRKTLDACHAARTERPLRWAASAVLRSVGLLQEQAGGEGSAPAHVAAGVDAGACGGFDRLRPAVVQEHVRLPHLEGGRPAGWHGLQLSSARR